MNLLLPASLLLASVLPNANAAAADMGVTEVAADSAVASRRHLQNLLGDWAFCTSSNQCNNQCCSSKYSTSDGKLKCTPVGGFKPWEGCVGDSAPAPAPSNSPSVSAGITVGSSAGEDTYTIEEPSSVGSTPAPSNSNSDSAGVTTGTSAGEDTDATDEPSSVGTSAGSNSAGEDTSLELGVWAFCTSSNQCNNQCCSSKYSTSDGRLKCTPVGGFKPSEGCVGDSAPAPAPSNSNSVSAGVTVGSSAGEDTGAVARPEIWVIVLCVTLALAVVGLCALGVKKLRQKNEKNAAVGGGKVVVSPHAAAAPTVMAAEDQLPTVYALPEENVITAVPPPQAYAYVATSAPPPTVNVTAEPYDSKYGY